MRLVARLRAAHTAAGFLTVAASVAGAAARHDRAMRRPCPTSSAKLIEAALVLGGIVVLWVVCRRGRSERRLDNRLDRALITYLPGAALALLVLAAAYAAWSRPDWISAGALPGDVTFSVIALGQGTLVVVLAAVSLDLYRRTPEPRTVMYGLGGPVVAMLACALGGVMSGGVSQRVADWLDGPGTPGMGRGSAIEGPPVLLSWQASVIPVLLVLLAVPALLLLVRTWLAARALEPGIDRAYEEERPDPARTRQIARIQATAALTDSAPWILGPVCGAALLLGAAAVCGAWVSGEVPGLAMRGSGPFIESIAQAAQSTGSWMVGLGFVLFVTWGRRAYRDASARRTIGILWDVGTFWPRAAHPFAPPCYAERAVPDLASRMSSWTALTRGRLVISGHSQGSVLAASAVWQLPAETRSRVALLTYGSPIERLYGRWFPAYFGPGPLHALHRSVHCWRNLWRATDPIGGRVRLDEAPGPEVDRGPLKDPLAYGRTREHPLPEAVLGHSDYQADPVFAQERAALLERLDPVLPRQAAWGGRFRGPADSGQFRQVLGVEQGEVVRARLGELGDPAGMPLHHRLEGLARGAAVAERRTLGKLGEVLQQRLPGPGGQAVLVLVGLLLHDPQQFGGLIIAEGDGPRETGCHTGVDGEEPLHLVGVAGDDDDHRVPVVLHQLHQCVDRLPAEVPAGVLGRQGVRLVDEQHPAARPVEGLLGTDGGRADVLADQIDAGHLDQMAPLQHPERGEDLAVQPGHGGLAGAGGAGEDEVAPDRRGLEPGLPAPHGPPRSCR